MTITWPPRGKALGGLDAKDYVDAFDAALSDALAQITTGTGDMRNADNLAFLNDFAAARTNLDVPDFAFMDQAIATAIAAVIISAGAVTSVNTQTGDVALTATNIPFTPNGSIAATDVQTAIQEVRDESGSGGAVASVNGQTGTVVLTAADVGADASGAAAAAQAASQPVDADLTAIAALSTTAYGRALLALVDAAALRTVAGLGTAATHAEGDFDLAGAAATAELNAKAYADLIAAGFSPRASCLVATAAALPACTYANGASGVGATLTATANGALTVDTVVVPLNARVLVKDQASTFQDGIYTQTQVGDGSTPFILTRATDADASADVPAGMVTFITDGTAPRKAAAFVQLTPGPLTIGTSPQVFDQSGGSVSLTFSNGLVLTGSNVAPTYGSTANTVTQGNDTRLSDARTPTAHAASHASAGSDAITLAQSQITGLVAALAALQPIDSDLTAIAALTTTSFGRGVLTLADAAALRTLAALGNSAVLNVGTIAGTVAAGNDSRFTDARTPLAHKVSHQLGGVDELALAESQVTNLTADLAGKLAAASNLSDVASPTTARTNLGLGSSATHAATDFEAVVNKDVASGYAALDSSGGLGLTRRPPATRMGLPLRAFRLALGDRATTLAKEVVVGDSLGQLLVSDAEQKTWPALYEQAMASAYNALPRSSGHMTVDVPAGFPFPQLVHWDTLAGTQTSDVITGVSTNVAANTFGYTAHPYVNGQPISFSGLSATTGVANNTRYYVVGTAANTFQVALTIGGTAIDLTGANQTATVTAVSLGGLWGRCLTAGQVCEVTRDGDGVTIFYTAQKTLGDTVTVAINGSTVGTINSTDATIGSAPNWDCGRSVSYVNPDGYGPMQVTVTNTSGSGRFLLDGCYIAAGNLDTGYQLHQLIHGGWGFFEFTNPNHPTALNHIKNQLPQLVTIILGLNDANNFANAAAFATMISTFVAAVRTQYGANPLPSIRVIFEPDAEGIAPATWATEYRAAARQVCETDGDLGFIDWFEVLGTYGPGNDDYGIAPADGVHPADAGHFAMAEAMKDATLSGGQSTGGNPLLDPYIALTRATITGQPALRMGDGTGDTTKNRYLVRATDGSEWGLVGAGLTASLLVKTLTKTASYTFILADGGRSVHYNNTTPGTFTVPPNSSVAFPLGTKIQCFCTGTGDLTVAAGSGVTILVPPYLALVLAQQNSSLQLRKTATDTWVVEWASDLTVFAAYLLALASGAVTRTAVKTANYTAIPGDLVPCDTTGGAFTVTLPDHPAHGAKVVVHHIALTGQTTVTIKIDVAGGSTDVFDIAGNQTSWALWFVGAAVLEYDEPSRVWSVMVTQTSAGDFAITDNDASHGKIRANVSGFGPALNLFGAAGDSAAKVVVGSTGISIGPGGSTATDFKVLRTGTAAGAVTGALTLTSPVLNTGVSGTAVDTDSTFAANSDTKLPSQKAVKTALAGLQPIVRTAWATDANVTLAAPTTYLAHTGAITASRTVTLPAATAYPAGTAVTVADEAGTVTSTLTIIISRAGSDTVNASTFAVIGTAYGMQTLVTDGTSKWTTVDATKLNKTSNLADLVNAGTARTNLGLVIGTNVQAWDADLDTIAALADPNADRMLFWDDSAGAYAYLTPGTNLTITGTTIDAAAGTPANDSVTNAILANMATTTIKGRVTAGTGDPEDLTAAQAKTVLAITESDVTGLVADLAAKAPLASPTFTGAPNATGGTFELTDGTAGHGKVRLADSVLGPAVSLFGDTADTAAKVTMGPTGVQIGPGGSTAADVKLLRTGTGAATVTGTLTIPSPAITTPTGIVKGDVGLGSVDNTADTAKPVSTAQQTALDLKANLASPTFTGTVVLPAQTVTRAMEVNQAANSFRGNNTGSAAAAVDLTVAQAKTLLAIAEADVTNLVTDLGNKQPLDSDLTTLAGLTATTDNMIQSVGSAWASRTPAQVKTALALTIGSNVQAWDADLDSIAALTTTTLGRANLTQTRTTFSNAAATISSPTTVLAQIGTLSASRIVTLPAASAYAGGTIVTVVDESGTVTATNTLVVTCAGSDTFYNTGQTTETVRDPGGFRQLVSDGTSKWIVVARSETSAANVWQPGIVASTMADIGGSTSAHVLGAASQKFFKVPLLRPSVIANVNYEVVTAATVNTHGYIAWYDSGGTMRAQSADLATPWQSTGAKTTALSYTPVWTGPDTFGWIMFYTGTTTANFAIRGGNVAAGLINAGSTTATLRCGSIALADTATMPNITTTNMVSTAVPAAVILT